MLILFITIKKHDIAGSIITALTSKSDCYSPFEDWPNWPARKVIMIYAIVLNIMILMSCVL